MNPLILMLITVCVAAAACSDETAAGRNSDPANVEPNNGVVPAVDEEAVCGAECLGGEPLCDAARRVCVECATDSHCGVAAPACDARGECQQCVSDTHCFGDRPVCDLAESECVPACTSDADCDGGDGFDFCDTTSGRCLQCRSNTDCGDGERPLCGADGRCVECETSDHCGADNPICDTTRGRCRECLANADCPSGACVDFECAECAADDDCPAAAPICDVEDRQCVVCVGNADCPEATPICDDGERCVECTEDDECADGEQCQDGVCEPQ